LKNKQLENKLKKQKKKASEKLLDKIMEGKEEISLYEKDPTPEEITLDVFERFCVLNETLINEYGLDPRSILLVILRDQERWFKIDEQDITGLSPEVIKNKLKDMEMFGYITAISVKKLDQQDNFICDSFMRTLYTPKLLIKSIIDFDGKMALEPVKLEGRKGIYDDYDLWCRVERPIKEA
jgi:hypothetical protein